MRLPISSSGVPTLVVQSKRDRVARKQRITPTSTVRVEKLHGGHGAHLGDYRALLGVIERNWPEQHANPT